MQTPNEPARGALADAIAFILAIAALFYAAPLAVLVVDLVEGWAR